MHRGRRDLILSLLLRPLAQNELLHLFKLVELAIAEAGRAVALVAYNTRVAVLIASDDHLAPSALHSRRLRVLNDHRLAALAEMSKLLDAALLRASAHSFPLSAV